MLLQSFEFRSFPSHKVVPLSVVFWWKLQTPLFLEEISHCLSELHIIKSTQGPRPLGSLIQVEANFEVEVSDVTARFELPHLSIDIIVVTINEPVETHPIQVEVSCDCVQDGLPVISDATAELQIFQRRAM